MKKKFVSEILKLWIVLFASAVLLWFGDALIDKIFFYEESYEEIAVTNVSVFEIYFRSALLLLLAIAGFIATRRILEKRKSENLIDFERDQTLKIFDSIDEQIYIIDPASKEILYKNNKVKALFGESANKKCFEYFNVSEKECAACSMPLLLKGDAEVAVSRDIYNSRLDRWFHSIEKKIKWIDGRDAIYTIQIDITVSKKAEQEYHRASKMETLEVIAGSIVHDFNNVLTTIIMSLSLSKQLTESNEKARSLIIMAENAAYRAKDITHQLLMFGQTVDTVMKQTHLEKLLNEATEFVMKGTGIKYSFESERNLPLAEADAGQITQLMNNLLINAKQAVKEDGEIKVKLESVAISGKNQLPLKDGKYLKISVTDNGVGISADDIHKIFDPYFTTKKEGSGLGLASSYMIVKRHGGYIQVESTMGKETIFTVYIPASDERRQSRESERMTTPLRPISGIIMDDDEILANVTAMMMNYGGNKIVAVNSIEKALEALEQKANAKERCDVIILDNTLPNDIKPKDAIKILKGKCAKTKFLLMLSVETEAAVREYTEAGFDLVLGKPIKPEILVKKIAEAIK